MKKVEDVKQINDRWKNRRQMAWITFLFDHTIILYMLVFQPSLGGFESIINTFLIMSGSIIGAYIGFATYDDVKSKKYDNEEAYKPEPVEDGDER